MSPGPIRILCVDDHHLMREGIALIINAQPDLEVVASAATGEQAIAMFREHRPDITLMDLRLPTMSGFEAVRLIRAEFPAARIIVLTIVDDGEGIRQALEAGAAAYLFKHTLSDDMIRVIREVHEGTHQVFDSVAARLAERATHPPLTPRELEVMNLMAQAMRNREIAAALGVSEHAALMHVKNIFSKLGVSNRVAAINTARRFGLIGAS
jgi:two-component system NarL family response regulator